MIKFICGDKYGAIRQPLSCKHAYTYNSWSYFHALFIDNKNWNNWLECLIHSSDNKYFFKLLNRRNKSLPGSFFFLRFLHAYLSWLRPLFCNFVAFRVIQKLEAQWAEPVSLTFHSALRKLNTEPSMLPIKFRFIWPSGFRGEDLKKNSQSETRIACGDHVWYWIITKCALFREDLP